MVRVIVQTAYPPEFGLEGDTLAIDLAAEYRRTALDVHRLISLLLAAGVERLELVDVEGEIWGFWSETIGTLVVMDVPTATAAGDGHG